MTLDLTKKGFKQSYFSADYFITINDAIFMDHPELIHFGTYLIENFLNIYMR